VDGVIPQDLLEGQILLAERLEPRMGAEPTYWNLLGEMDSLAVRVGQDLLPKLIDLQRRVLLSKEKQFGEDQPETAVTFLELAWLNLIANQFVIAEDLSDRALDIFLETHTPGPACKAMFGLACLYIEKQHYVSAEPLLMHVLSVESVMSRPSVPIEDICKALSTIIGHYLESSQPEDARLLVDRALLMAGQSPNYRAALENLFNITNLSIALNKESAQTD
jgi:hypothetical protein